MTIQKTQSDRATSVFAGEERRRSQRVFIRMPVTLEITMAGQKKMTVAAHTVSVNVHGAMVLCSRPLVADTNLEILNDSTRERTSGRVTRAPRESSEGYLIPVEFSKPSPSFWQISFPATDWKPFDG
jgi:hypothetical protein